jgi:hypothetical protein
MPHKIQYGLRYRKTGDMLHYYTVDNDSHYAVNKSHYLTHKEDEGEGLWLLDKFEDVIMTRWVSEEWYNSRYDSPVNPYSAYDTEIVKVVTMLVTKDANTEYEIEVVNSRLKEGGWATLDEKYIEKVRGSDEE